MIAIVDDEQELLGLTSENLNKEFANEMIFSYFDPVLALKDLATEKPTVLILDFLMPKLNGIQLAGALRAIHGPLVPVIFWTGDANNKLYKYQQLNPMTEIIFKPDYDQLISKVLQWISPS